MPARHPFAAPAGPGRLRAMLEEEGAGTGSGAEPVLRGDAAPSSVAPASVASPGAAPRPAPARPGALARLSPLWLAVLHWARARPGVYRDPFTWATVCATFGAYCVISLFRLFQLHPTSWDLGIYTEYVKQYAYLH